MLSLKECESIVLKNRPKGVIKAAITYRNEFVFVVYPDSEVTFAFDAYVAVNFHSGYFRDFSIYTDGDTAKIIRLFASKYKSNVI